jgi:hypothetical protein
VLAAALAAVLALAVALALVLVVAVQRYFLGFVLLLVEPLLVFQ